MAHFEPHPSLSSTQSTGVVARKSITSIPTGTAAAPTATTVTAGIGDSLAVSPLNTLDGVASTPDSSYSIWPSPPDPIEASSEQAVPMGLWDDLEAAAAVQPPFLVRDETAKFGCSEEHPQFDSARPPTSQLSPVSTAHFPAGNADQTSLSGQAEAKTESERRLGEVGLLTGQKSLNMFATTPAGLKDSPNRGSPTARPRRIRSEIGRENLPSMDFGKSPSTSGIPRDLLESLKR